MLVGVKVRLVGVEECLSFRMSWERLWQWLYYRDKPAVKKVKETCKGECKNGRVR
jgi:hypothetical protein